MDNVLKFEDHSKEVHFIPLSHVRRVSINKSQSGDHYVGIYYLDDPEHSDKFWLTDEQSETRL